MDKSSENMETEFIPVKEDAVVFTTEKSMNERFTPKHQRCVFIVKNGYTAPFKNNKVKERIIIRSRVRTNTHIRFSQYKKHCDGNPKAEIERNTTLKEDLHQVSKKRRIVLLQEDDQPENCGSGESNKLAAFETKSGSLTEDPDKGGKLHADQAPNENGSTSRTYSRKRRRSKRIRKRLPKVSATGSFHNLSNDLNENEPIIYSPFFCKDNPYYFQSLYKWTRAPLTKEDLDRELDSYMAQVDFKPQCAAKDDVDSFVQEFIRESEKYLNL